MTSCSVSNGMNKGLHIEQPYHLGQHCSVKESNFTKMKRPLYVASQKVEFAFNRFHHNLCGSENNCVTVQAFAYQSLSCYGKRIKQSSMS